MNRALRAATMGVLLLSPVVLSACSAGQVTQTAAQERDKTGAQGQVGDISLRQAQLVHPRGGSYEPGDDAELQAESTTGDRSSTPIVAARSARFTAVDLQQNGPATAGSVTRGSPGA